MTTFDKMSNLPDFGMKDLNHGYTFSSHSQASDAIEQTHSPGGIRLTPKLSEEEQKGYVSHSIRSTFGKPAPVFVDVILLFLIGINRF